jgi:hypothetical protein
METINDKLIAKTIDLINDFLYDYYERKHNILPNHENLTTELNKVDNRINDPIITNAVFVMKELEYIKYETDPVNPTVVVRVIPTTKGLLLKVNGGLTKALKRQNTQDRLYWIGQFSIAIAGIYYLMEIIKIFYDCCFK